MCIISMKTRVQKVLVGPKYASFLCKTLFLFSSLCSGVKSDLDVFCETLRFVLLI